MTRNESLARWLALLVPAALLGGAWYGQLFAGLYPCEMCHWQRWPHYAALGFVVLAFVVSQRSIAKSFVILAALLIAISGVIGAYHAGVEYRWWQGMTACTATARGGLDAILAAPVIPCDIAQWTLGGVSLAGFNAIISLTAAAIILFLMRRAR